MVSAFLVITNVAILLKVGKTEVIFLIQITLPAEVERQFDHYILGETTR